MGIKEVIETINRMQAGGVIERYAIGGAVGATFYLEPVATLDVDVFVELHIPPGSQLVSPEPIFKYLRDRGCNEGVEFCNEWRSENCLRAPNETGDSHRGTEDL